MLAWQARELLQDTIDRDKGASFSLISDWIDQVKKADNSTYIKLKTIYKNEFKAIFIILRSIRLQLHFLRPFYTLDGTYT